MRATDDPSSAGPCAISAVIATSQPWPEVEPCLESLHGQIAAIGGEIVLGDASPHGLPAPVRLRYPRLHLLHRPDTSVFELRAEAIAHSCGAIVAITEDHCVVAPDWCERILAAHRENPQAAAIGGAVENGATATTIDWASFFLVNGGSIPPLREGAQQAIALQANVSYKRRALPPRTHVLGQMEWILNRDLRRSGAALVSDDRIRVSHVQSLGVGATCRIHYDDGRTIASFRMERAADGTSAMTAQTLPQRRVGSTLAAASHDVPLHSRSRPDHRGL